MTQIQTWILVACAVFATFTLSVIEGKLNGICHNLFEMRKENRFGRKRGEYDP